MKSNATINFSLVQSAFLGQIWNQIWSQMRLPVMLLSPWVGLWVTPITQAQITPANDGTGSVVIQRGDRFDISAGKLSRDGSNLFQSFQQFGLTQGQIANFLTDPAVHNILARVVGGDPSYINGLLQVTGSSANLYLLNPAGIVFGANASLNVPASFTASTATGVQIGQNWLDGLGSNQYAQLMGTPSAFAFATSQPGAIFNAGNLRVEAGQSLTLLGGTIVSTGTLTAPGGSITIAAVPGHQLVRISQSGSLLSLDLPLTTSPPGNGIPLSLPALLTGGNLTGATGVMVDNGIVRLTGSGVTIPTEVGTTIVAGTLDTTSTTGTSQIQVLGKQVGLLGASVDASGRQGGTVLIGGDYQGLGTTPTAQATFVSADSLIRADALSMGNGGKVIVWADGSTRFYGSISAKGGMRGGDGGLVETSGKQSLDVGNATVDATAIAGQAGVWLLDPTDITVALGGTGGLTGGIFDPAINSTISPITIANALNAGINVTITTSSGTGGNGDITLVDSINQGAPSLASLTLTGRQFLRPGIATINLNGSGRLIFNLNQVNPQAAPPGSSIQNAIDAIGTVAGPATINIGTGTYTLTTPLNIAKSLNLNGSTGAGATTLSGNNAVGVLNISSAGTNVTLSNLTIQNGLAAFGGGIFNNGSNLVILNSTFSGNRAVGANGVDGSNFGAGGGGGGGAGLGGAIFSTGGTVTIDNSIFSGNQAIGGNGGAGFPNNGVFDGIGGAGGGTAGGAGGDPGLSGGNGGFGSGGGGGGGSALVGGAGGTGGFGGGGGGGGGLTSGFSGQPGGTGGFGGGTGAQGVASAAAGGGGGAGLGGAIFANSGSLTLTNTTISNNSAVGGQGGISGFLSAPGSNGQGMGGALFVNTGTSLNLASNIISGNSAANFGGGIFNSGTLTVNSSTLSGNNSTNSYGGGIYNVGTATVSNSTFSNNLAPTFNLGGGGVANDHSGTLAVTNSTFVGNSAYNGGGILNLSGSSNISNSTFTSNSATFGGGLYILLDTLTINSSTISGNSAVFGGGIFKNIGTLTIGNSIVANNTATSSNPDVLGNIISQGNNIILDPTGGSGFVSSDLLNVDPRLAPLGNYGGPTQTMALLPGSPAINGGGAGATTADQRGVPAVGVRDIGAYESAGFLLVPIAGNGQTTLVNNAFGVPLQVRLLDLSNNQPILVAGIPVIFTVPVRGASGVFTTSTTVTVLTDAQGIVTAPTLFANDIDGNYIVTANSPGTVSATFSLSNLPISTPTPTPTPTPTVTIPPAKAIQQNPTPGQPAIPVLSNISTPVLSAGFDATETGMTNQFVDHLELSDAPKTVSLAGALNTLRNVESAAGIRPALIYVNFISPETGESTRCAIETQPKLTRDPNTGNLTLQGAECGQADLQLLLVTSSGKLIRKRIPGATRAKVLAVAKRFRYETSDPSKVRTRTYLATAKQLYRWVIAPLEADLKTEGIDTLTFILDSGLRSMPLAALHDGQNFLVERYRIGLMPSLSLANTEYADLRKMQVLAAGATQFVDHNPLPAVSVELAAINDRWRGQSILDKAFTFDNLVKERKETPFGIIHLATHGQFLPGKLSNSYIQLADKRLGLNQLRQLGWANPPVELVVLSACEMAVGDDNAELGFAGFAVKAGAKSALASLWSVSDEGTAGLMAEFYEQLWKQPVKSEALRQAQRAMISGKVRIENGQLIWSGGAVALPPELADRSNQDLSHPYYWSTFTLIGSPW